MQEEVIRDILTGGDTLGRFAGASIGKKAHAQVAFHIVYPSTRKETIEWVEQFVKQLKSEPDWKKGGNLTVGEWGTSYPPYQNDLTTPNSDAFTTSVAKRYGHCRTRTGDAWCDTNLYARYLNGGGATSSVVEMPPGVELPDSERQIECFDIAAIGGCAHEPGEYVNEASLVKNIDFYRGFIEEDILEILNGRKL